MCIRDRNVGSNIKLGTAGVVTATSFVGGLPITSGADNKVITASSASSIQGEANLTYDGTNLQLTTDANNEGIKIDGGVTYPVFEMTANRGAGNTLGKLVSKWNGTQIASISFVSGTDTSNKDDGIMYFNTASSGTPLERLRITSSGALGTNSIVRSANGGLDLCSQGATNYGTLTLGAGGGQNGQSRSSNQENQFRIMMPTYANPSNMTTVLYGTSGSGGHDLHYGGGTGWAYATNSHRFFTTANQTTGNGTERLRINSSGQLIVNSVTSTDAIFTVASPNHYVVTSAGRAHKHIHCRAVNGNSGEFGGAISFGMGSNGSSAIAAEQMGTDGNVNGLAFFTHPTSSSSDDSVKRMKINSTGGITLNNWGSNRGFIFERLDSGGASYPDFANVQGSNGRGMISSQKTINQNTTTDLCKSHWGGLALVGYSGSGHQGVRQVMFGYGGAGASVRFSGNWVGSLTTTFTVSAYTLRVSHNASNALDFWVILIGI